LLGGRYRTGRELGHGGMATVYLARDIKHGRDVAVKVIRAELAASLGRDRFLREIAIAARLRHPNIVPLFDSGDADGVLYFVMPYEDGPSARARLASDGPLSIAETVSVLRDVARALHYAHSHGVVHRDIKPDNVMMSGGAAVVADFGIAKAIAAAAGGDRPEHHGAQDLPATTITQVGAGIGTPAYMAPEQAVGDPSTDHRADIYSYGCLAYELLTGKPPFHDAPAHQIIASHVAVAPKPVTEMRPDVPPALAMLVARCLEKNPAARPQTAAELLDIVDHAMDSTTHDVVAPARRSRVLLSSGLIVVAGLAAAAYFLRDRIVPTPPISLSVLPFANISGDTAITPFADGIGDEVFSALVRVPGLQMRSRSGARQYRGALSVDAKEVGRKLNVDYVVTGVMREAKGHWIVSAELTRTADGTELWTDSFDRSPEQPMGVAEEIANAATTSLRKAFPRALGVAVRLTPNQQTTNPEAFRLYLVGQEQLRRRGQSVRESAGAFREAIRLDSSYAGAYAGLSMALSLYPYFQGVPPAEVSRELSFAAKRALQLDSTLSQPHVALGMAAQQAYQWDSAETEFRTALRLASNDAEGRVQYGRHLLVRGMITEGLEQLELARRADPASPLVLGWLSYAHYLLGQVDSARVLSAQARQGSATNLNLSSAVLGGLVLLGNGARDSARALGQHVAVNGDPDKIYLLAATGDTVDARADLRAADTNVVTRSTINTAKMMFELGVGDTAQALTLLERATEAREIWPVYVVISDPIFDPIRRSQRLLSLLRRVGLTPSAAERPKRGGPR
jgi:serine/threonine-protein kinase